MKNKMNTYTNLFTFPTLMLWVFLFATNISLAKDGSGLKTSIGVDILGQFKLSEESNAPDNLVVRSAEVSFYAPVDHHFDGVLSLAAHRENGVSLFEVHEAVLSSDRFIPMSQFKLGQFFLGLGRLNQFHQHDWPFTKAPIVYDEFLGGEGIIDSGGEYSILLPLPFYFELTLGITSGYVFGHSHNAGKKPKIPTNYARTVNFFSVMDFDVQTGLNYLYRKDSQGLEMLLLGLDITSKKELGKGASFLWQSEVWYRDLTSKESTGEKALGLYTFPEWGASSLWRFGLRFDYHTILNKKDLTGKHLENYKVALEPALTYKASEFSKIRLTYSFLKDHMVGKEESLDQSVVLQSVFILGAHPSHSF